ncbi:BTB/POZ protein [Halteromyces radiatus]|uniref:BTB/POZ protein n=1 Tax=Halteromyces radiatus TaxID=101107 RepID=UPI0022205841|nr:BTB/POZ protein [Halteromyces radiatus]KAI8081776.1 BTB/POZ protein [Halteromyces radiatus]
MLNESYQATKRNIYKEINTTLGDLQQLESRFEASKLQFHGRIEKEYEEWSYQLDLQRRKLEQRKRTLNDTEPRDITAFQNKIKLNVGGVIFETSLATLKREESSLLATMFSGKHVLKLDAEGSYFIDRDPTHFRLVLNYLRDLRISPAVIQDNTVCQELLHEAQYYRIEGLIKLLQQ